MTDAIKPMGYYARIRHDRAILTATFPACFMAKGVRKIPLARGIDAYLMERPPSDADGRLSNTRIRNALRDYTTGPKYLTALIGGGDRITLDGTQEGHVTEYDSAWAWDKLNTEYAEWIRKWAYVPPERKLAA